MASNRKDQIDGMADAAALGAVTPAEMAQSSTVAQARSKSLFTDQVATVQGATVLPADVNVGATMLVDSGAEDDPRLSALGSRAMLILPGVVPPPFTSSQETAGFATAE